MNGFSEVIGSGTVFADEFMLDGLTWQERRDIRIAALGGYRPYGSDTILPLSVCGFRVDGEGNVRSLDDIRRCELLAAPLTFDGYLPRKSSDV